MKKQGFTLMELMIALAIFAFIGIATVRLIQQIKNTRDISFEQLETYNGLRAALSIMRTDVSQAFHILYDDLGEENKTALFQNADVPHTLFDGRKNSMVFTSLSHRVYYAGRRESEQTEISFFLEKTEPKDEFPSLMKRESEFIDENLFEGGEIYTLLRNVKSLSLQYWNDQTRKWEDDWDSDGRSHRDRFPKAVKINLEAVTPKGNIIPVETEFKIAFPNNEKILTKF